MKRQKKIFLFSFLSILFLGSFLFLSFAFAQADPFGLQQVEGGIGLGGQDIRLTIAKIIRAVLGLLGIIALGIMLYGGFVYMTAGGNEERVGTAKKILINGVIGLVIILSSFSIAQFIINQLGKATGAISDGKTPQCENDDYALENLCQCYDIDCDNELDCKGEGLEEGEDFIVKSISPVTYNTGMNNVIIRAIFNKSVADKFASDKIFDIKRGGKSVSSSFNFEFFEGTERQLLEATYTGEEFCLDDDTGEHIPCIDFGTYGVEIRGDLESEEGYLITEETECGFFPTGAEFIVDESDESQKLSYLEFDGIDGRVFINGTSTADFVDDFSMSFWVYVDDQVNTSSHKYIIDNFTGGDPGAGYLIYYVQDDEVLNDGVLRFSVRRDNPTLYSEDSSSDQKSIAYDIEEKKWQHVVTTFSGDNMSMYVGGELVADLDLPDNYPLYQYPGQLVFGGTQSLASDQYSFKGKLDEVRIYEKVLSTEEILELSTKRESSKYDGLYAGYHFEDVDGISVGDLWDGEYHGEISGGVEWVEPEWGQKFIDKEPPVLDISLLDAGDGEYLDPGKAYWIYSEITDNSGLGAYHVKYTKQTIDSDDKESPLDYFDGPRILDGSDAPVGDPFILSGSDALLTSHNPEKTIHYTLTLDAFDIDSKLAQETKQYTLLPAQCSNGKKDEYDEESGILAEDDADCGGPCPACQGDFCIEDWQCENGNKCIDNICTPWPKIVEIDPMHGAAGNWVTIYGYNFGENQGDVMGEVKFAIDQDGDGEVSAEEWLDEFFVTVVNDPDCEETWRDNYIVVELPDDDILPQGTKSAVKVAIIRDEKALDDTTIDDYGPNLGLFEKDDQKLPGLCSVKTVTDDPTIEGATAAKPGVEIKIVGKNFGVIGDKRVLYFDLFDVAYDYDSQTKIFSEVPNLNLFGETAVSVDVNDKKSNSIKFEILPDGLDPTPVIEKIDPIDPTAGSYITIFGSGFGDVRGDVYFSTSTMEVEKCVKADSVDAGECDELNLIDFPLECGKTWKNEQIIAKLPLDTLPGDYFLALRTEAGYFTSGVGVDGIAGEEPLELLDGEPNPGICKIDPDSGVAPRLGDTNTIKIYGDNFTSPNDTPKVYFWTNSTTTSPTDPNTWMNTGINVYPPNSVKSITKQEIETEIPYIDKAGSEEDGSSMQSGPIKVGVDGRFSNGVEYVVSDCREASAEEAGLMQDGYQCCESEGPDQGKWKSNEFVCIGETRDAGYVWRFSTGQINAKPRVLEQCDEKNWNGDSFDGKYPSPTPSLLWPTTGYDACTNATVAVKFNIPMDSTTINSSTVKMYSCGSGAKSKCDEGVLVSPTSTYPVMTGENVLEIRSIPPDEYLATSTWYRVELSEDIMSVAKPANLGELASQVYNLQITSDCVDDDEVDHCIGFGSTSTAYFFEFKTGNFDCQMTDAEVEPKTYTTHYLGKLYSPDGVPPNPLYYFVWGFSDRECIVLSPDQYAWDWKADPNSILNINIEPKEGMPTSTSRVSLDALAEHPGVKVEASTSIVEEGEGYEKYTNNILEDIDKPAGLIVTSTDGVLVLEDFEAADFVSFGNYKINLKYSLNEMATSSMSEISTPFVKSYTAERYLYDDGINYILVEDYIAGTNKTRKLVSNLWGDKPSFIHTYNENKLLEWNRGSYIIINDEDGFRVRDEFAENEYEPIYSGLQKQPNDSYENTVVLGALNETGPVKNNLLFGSIDELIIERENPVENTETVITATNTTTIEVYPPVVIDYGPNCAEACVNASFWVKFSRPMAQIKYDNNMELYECETESCTVTSSMGITKSDTSDILVFSANLNSNENSGSGLLASSTWYQVVVKGGDENGEGGVRAIGSISEGVVGKAMEEDFIWKFRTKSDPSPCKVDDVRINPNPFIAQIIGEQTKYSAIPQAEPDSCSSIGQELNPWSYGWSWQTGDEVENVSESKWVASVTNFSFGTQMSPYCNLGCVLAGSNISTDVDKTYLCGNGTLDPGEDCDIAKKNENTNQDEEIGVSCTLDCLRPGNSLSGVEGEDNTCGNGEIETGVGEKCDPGGDKTEWQYCTQNCLNVGSSQEFIGDIDTPWCGSGSVTDSEDCDLDLSVEDIAKMGGSKNEAAVGCSEDCLHLGTPLEQAWCDDNSDNPDYADECGGAVSWCGNDKLESGEECEIVTGGLEIPTSNGSLVIDVANPSNYCTDKCLLQDICELTDIPEKSDDDDDDDGKDGLRCDSDEEGCNNDCTLAGSSVSYVEASLCGDGTVGVGESGLCEAEDVDAENGVAVGNAVQRVYALGRGDVSEMTVNDRDIIAQYTTVEATVESYFDIENGQSVANELEENAKVAGFGDYYIACGYEEYAVPEGVGVDLSYNQCPFTIGQDKNTFGVADNSCCYERPYRVDSYPSDGAGLNGTETVCPNTLIEFDFNSEIDKNSIEDNFIIAIGHEGDHYQCSEDGLLDVSDIINNTIPTIAKAESGGLLENIWNFVKRFFVKIIGGETYATKEDVGDIKVWCASEIGADFDVLNREDVNGQVVTSTVKFYIDSLLPKDSYIAVYLEGGNDGITDIRGVGIRNHPDEIFNMLQDSIVFVTGPEVCKIESVEVNPDQYLFNKPNTTHEFEAITKTKTGQSIVKIPGQYDWDLEWQPQDNEIVNIPESGFSATSSTTTFGVNNLQGSLVAVANIKITEDVDTEGGSHEGLIFTGLTDIEVNFCENPWPARDANDNWQPFEDGVYNFSMSYCADAGLSDEKLDDLPFLNDPLSFVIEDSEDGVFVAKHCRVSGNICDSSSDCVGNLYDIPGVGEISLPDNKGLCWQSGDVYLEEGGGYKICESDNGCFTSASAELVFEVGDGNQGNILEIIEDSGDLYSIFEGPVESGLLLADVSDPENSFMLSSANLEGAKNMELVKEKYIFVVSEVAGVQILNIFERQGDDLLKVKELSGPGGSMEDLSFYNNKLYILSDAGTNGRLYVYNLVDLEPWLEKPDFVLDDLVEQHINLEFEPRKITLGQDKNKDYIAILSTKEDSVTSVQVFDANNYKLELTGQVSGTPKSIDFENEEIFFTVSKGGVEGELYRVRLGAGPEEILSFSVSPNLVKVDSESIYISFGTDKFSVFDKEDFTQILTYSAPLYINTFDVSGDYLYTGSFKTGIYRILDISASDSNLGFNCNTFLEKYHNSCIPIKQGLIFSQALKEDSLWSYLFFNDKNDDAFGIQIFKNSAETDEFEAKSIGEWYAERFDNLSQMQTISLAGYDGLTDGRNYYINALNETPTGGIYSNVYLFSVNKDAQQNTLQMFEKVLNSIEFNINISDHGSCLDENITNLGSLPEDDNINSITGVDCTTDFDCRDLFGAALGGTNGMCSNAKTKMFRDWARLPKIGELQNKIINLDFPELKSGTFLPGYTVSRWPNSWSTFGIQDEINTWVGCDTDDNIDSFTCWNAVSSTYHCPAFSSVFEYKFFDKDEEYYMLHGPLEYFDMDSPMVEYFIDTPFFTTEPWCVAESNPKSPFGEKCGDGIVNFNPDPDLNEECDPPGKTIKSNFGYLPAELGLCQGEFIERDCGVDADCPESMFYVDDIPYKVSLGMEEGVCLYNNHLLYGDTVDGQGELEVIQCSDLNDCVNYISNGPQGKEMKTLFNTPDILEVNSDFFLDPDLIDNFSCSSLQDINYFDNEVFPLLGVCEGAVPEGEGECAEGYQAVDYCNDLCVLQKGTCQEIYECGNGIVEGGEVCDDGALNGTYGHCAGENSVDENDELIGACQGLHGQFCGNGVKDVDAGGNSLEFCDFSVEVGICEGPDQKECTSDEQCVEEVEDPIEACVFGTCLISGNQCEIDTDCGFNIVDVPHECIMPTNGVYSSDKEYTCSWDCQSYGAYCGDGYVQSGEGEECDDGGNENQDGCNSECLKENIACIEKEPFYRDDFLNFGLYKAIFLEDLSYFDPESSGIEFMPENKPIVAGDPISECYNGTGEGVCRAIGGNCEKVQGFLLTEGVQDSTDIDCVVPLQPYLDNFEEAGDDEYYHYVVICEGGELDYSSEEKEEKTEEVCGNGIVETYEDEDTGKEVIEVCDLGDANGDECSPEYNSSCTYCSADCGEILTVDSEAYCGNGVIDFIDEELGTHEACDESEFDDIVVYKEHPITGEIISASESCPDKGEYLCENQCMDLVNNCVNCGEQVGGAVPSVKLLSVFSLDETDVFQWPEYGSPVDMSLFYGDKGVDDLIPLSDSFIRINTVDEALHFDLIKDKLDFDAAINTGLICNEPGKSYYVNFTNEGSSFQESSFFDFPVKNESEEVVNEYLFVPPATRQGTEFHIHDADSIFTAVIRWTDEEGDKGTFQGIVQNDEILNGEEMSYFKAVTNENLGMANFYNRYPNIEAEGDYAKHRIYVRPQVSLEDIFAQSFTIDTLYFDEDAYNSPEAFYTPIFLNEKFRFVVEAIGQPIYEFQNSKLKVEIYVGRNSIFVPLTLHKPDFEFYINAEDVKKSGNADAQYWHVFDLEKNNSGKYEIKPVQEVVTKWCQVLGEISSCQDD